MALANIAEIFFKKGLKVLIVDWDLEAPGLERFFFAEIKEILDKPGVIDMLLNYKEQMSQEISIKKDEDLPFEEPDQYIVDVHPNSKKGKLYLLTAGKRSEDHFSQYASSVLTFNWQDFYLNWEGELYLDWIRQKLEKLADVVLIDSRTGVNEMGGICTYQLADVVILFCAINQQNIEGTKIMAQNFTNPELIKYRANRDLKVIIVPARVEDRAEMKDLRIYEENFIKKFDRFLPASIGSKLKSFWELKIPHVPYYAFNETLAISKSDQEHPDDLVIAFKRLGSIMALLASEDSKLYISYYKKLIMIPLLPPSFLARTKITEVVRKALLSKGDSMIGIKGREFVVGICGMAGVGKTVLAAALARDEMVNAAFPDGIFWVHLGQNPNLDVRLSQLLRSFDDNLPVISSVEDGRVCLNKFLQNKSCLIILDDVWLAEHALAFVGLGANCRMLITTRNLDILRILGALENQLDVLTDLDALRLLALSSGQSINTLPLESKEIARECGNLPLALSMVGSMIRGRPDRWGDVLNRLRSADLSKIRATFQDYPYPDLLRTLEVSVEALDQEQKTKYLELAVFPEDISIPISALQTLWQTDEYDTQDLVTLLADRSLGKIEEGKLIIHDLQRDFLKKKCKDVTKLHELLLNHYMEKTGGNWASAANDGYLYQHLAYHLFEAGRNETLKALLLDVNWIQAKLLATDPSALISDYDYLAQGDLHLLQGAIELSAHILARDPTQLQSQLWGRLMGFESPLIQSVLSKILRCKSGAWLRTLNQSLSFPGGPLIRTLQGHNSWINALALTPDCRNIVSASSDNTLKIWNLENGKEISMLRGHTGAVNALALTSDGQRIISGSDDKTLKIWNFETCRELQTIQGHTSWVSAIAVTPDNKRVISGSWDRTIKIWDIETGQEIQTLYGHSSPINVLVLTSRGKKLVSGSDDGSIKIWDLEINSELQTFQGHASPIRAISLTPDGKKVISGSDDRTIKIWDLDTGRELQTLQGHIGSIRAISLTPDGKRVISGSDDRTIKIWDLDTGNELQMLHGHTNSVRVLAVTSDGSNVVSGSDDGTIKVWSPQKCLKNRTLVCHNATVSAIAVSPNGIKIVSASNDNTIKIWNRETCQELRTLHGHSDWVSAVAISPDSRTAVSGSEDNTLKVWDLETGEELQTLLGHVDCVRTVAISSDGKKAVSGSDDRTIKIWDLETGRELQTLCGHANSVRTLAVTADGKKVVSGSDDKTIRIWDLSTGREIRNLNGNISSVRALSITPDGIKAISGSSDNTINIWDLDAGHVIRTIKGHVSIVHSVALSTDGSVAVSASNDNSIKLWNLRRGNVIATFEGDAPFTACCILDKESIFAGDRAGKLHFICLENADH